MTTIVADDPFTFDRRADFDLLFLLVDDSMRKHLERLPGFPQQLQVLIVGYNSLAKVHRSVDNRLLLFPLQDTRDDTLSCNAIPSVVDNNRTQSVKSFD